MFKSVGMICIMILFLILTRRTLLFSMKILKQNIFLKHCTQSHVYEYNFNNIIKVCQLSFDMFRVQLYIVW